MLSIRIENMCAFFFIGCWRYCCCCVMLVCRVVNLFCLIMVVFLFVVGLGLATVMCVAALVAAGIYRHVYIYMSFAHSCIVVVVSCIVVVVGGVGGGG